MKLRYLVLLIAGFTVVIGLLFMNSGGRVARDASRILPIKDDLDAAGNVPPQHESGERAVVAQDVSRSEVAEDAAERDQRPPLASILRVELVPPGGYGLSGARVSFHGPEVGEVVTVATGPEQRIVELAIAPFMRIRAKNKYVGYMEVQAASFAKHQRWITVDEALAARSVAVEVQLQVGHDIHVVVTDQYGAVASGAVVLATGSQQVRQPGFVADWRVEADSDGRCVLEGLMAGDWHITAAQWKDWGASESLTLRFGPGERPSAEIMLVVERWSPGDYSSGVLEVPGGWERVHLEECGGVGRTYPVYGNEFYVRISQLDARMLRSVDGQSSKRSKCVRVVGGQHGLKLVVVPE